MSLAVAPTRVCFVCLGNICRSPTAEGIFVHLVERQGHGSVLEAESAGTAAYHEGEGPDRRATATARRRGVVVAGTARRFRRDDFERFDLVIAMDRSNRDDLRALASDEAAAAKIRLLREFDPGAPKDAEVPDPYYGGDDGFDLVFDICMAACRGLLQQLVEARGAR